METNPPPADTAAPPAVAAAASASIPARLSDPERWVEDHGDYLFKFALLRLRDPAKAEDMVQETFLAALKGGDKFAGRSAEKSWLVGILKNKICDHYAVWTNDQILRRRSRSLSKRYHGRFFLSSRPGIGARRSPNPKGIPASSQRDSGIIPKGFRHHPKGIPAKVGFVHRRPGVPPISDEAFQEPGKVGSD